MNRKGTVIGKILSTLPIFLLIVFFTALFLILTGFAVAIEKPKVPVLLDGLDRDNVLLRDMYIESRKVITFEGFVESSLNERKYEAIRLRTEGFKLTSISEDDKLFLQKNPLGFGKKLRDELIETMKKDNLNSFAGERSCFIFFAGKGRVVGDSFNNEKNIYVAFEKGKVIIKSTHDAGEYEKKGLLQKTSFSVRDRDLGNLELNFKHYYGKCLDVLEDRK